MTTKISLQSVLLSQKQPGWESQLATSISDSQSEIDQLMECFYSGDFRLSHRATQVILKLVKLNPSGVRQQVPKMVSTLSGSLPDWYKRNILRILQDQTIPEQQWGHAADQCFAYLSAPQEPVAVKVFSMTVLYNICRKIPELSKELRFLIEDQYPLASAGFKARARKVLKQMDKSNI